VLKLQQVAKLAILAWENPQRPRVFNSCEGDAGFCGRVASYHQAFQVSHDNNEAVHRRTLKLVEGHCKSGLDFKSSNGNWIDTERVCHVRRQTIAKGLKRDERKRR